MSEDNENKKSGLTVGGVSGSKKMRLGRVHKKKTEDAPEAPVEEVKVEAAAPVVETVEEKPAKKAPAKKAAASDETAEEKPAKKTTKKAAASEDKAEEKPA